MATVSYGTITITDTNDIEQIYMVYAGSSSDVQAPDKTNFSLWKTDITQVTGTYIWQRTVIKKSGINIDSSNFQNYYGEPVCVTGPEGTAARRITSVVPYYYLSTSSSNQTGGSWSTTPAAYPASGTYYYWTKTITTYDSGSPSESTPVLDRALNSANETARGANTTANNAKSKADTVEGNLNNYIASNDSALNALQTKTKYFWTNLVAHTMGSGGWTKPNYPVGTYAASGISGTNFDAEDSSTYGYNTLYSNGIKLRYNAINLSELTGSSLIFYRPSTTTQGTKGMELSSSSLKFYDSTGSVAQATFGGTQATISGTINAYDGKIGKGAAAWTIGNDSNSGKAMIYTGTRGSADSAYLSTGIGTESIGGSGTLNTTNDGYWTITAGANFGVTTKGKVYASSGKIGGWNLESNRLSIGTWGSDNSAMLCSGSSGAKSIGGSPSNISDWVFTAGSNFGVTKSGDLYCGNLNATGGSFTGALTATSLTVSPGATFDGDIDRFKGASFNWNLLLGTATPVTWTVTLNSSNYATKDCYKTITPVPSLFAVDDLVTVSFDWSTNATGGNFHVECGSVTPYSWGTVVKAEGGRSATSSYVDISSSNQSGHFKVTFKVGTAQTGAADTLQWLRIRVDGADTSGKSFTISNAKAERGSNASDWSPAESEIHGTDGASFNWNLLLDTLKDAGESHTIYTITDFNFAESTVEGEKYTISAKITTSSEKTAVGFFHSGGTFQMSGWLPVTSTGLYKTTFTATSEMASQKGGKGHGFCRVYVSNNPNKSAQGSYALAGTAHVDWIKIEKGETASDWCTAESEIHGKDGLDGISASGLAIKVNYSSYTTANTGECYFHGYNDSNEEADVDGWVMWNGVKLTITKGMWINPNGVPLANTPILHVFRTSTSPYHADVWWDSSLLKWRGYMYLSSNKTPDTIGDWTWNEATDCILAVYIATGNEEISSAQLFTTPKKFSELPNPNDIHSIVDTSIDGIEIGGRNLLQGTANPQISELYDPPYYNVRSGGNGVGSIESIEDSPVTGITKTFRITGNTTGNRDFVQSVEDFNILWTDGQWMFSCYARGIDASATALIRVYTANLAFQANISVGTSWTRIEVPISLNGSGAKTNEIKFQFGIAGAGSIEYIAPMLERGTKASAWSYAPEDIQGSIDSVNNTISGVRGDLTQTQGNLSRIDSAVENLDGQMQTTYELASGAKSSADEANQKYDTISSIVDDYNNLRNYYLDFNPTPSGISGLIIGARNSDGSDNAFKTQITNDSLNFLQNGSAVAGINANEFFINQGTIETGLRVGNFVIFDEDGALNIKYEPRLEA